MLTISFNNNDIDKKDLQIIEMLLREAGIKFNIEKVSSRGKYYDILYKEAECRVDMLDDDIKNSLSSEQIKALIDNIAYRFWRSESDIFDYEYMYAIVDEEVESIQSKNQ